MHISEPGCRNNPVEVLETKAPWLIDNYALRRDSGGPGEHRGGLGLVRSYRFQAEASALTLVKKTKTKPWGMAAGADGGNGHVILRPGTAGEEVTGMIYESMFPGDILVNNSGGGGGWGDPLKRDPEKVLADVRNDYVSLEQAREVYRVVIDADNMTVDREATAAARQAR